MSCSGVGLLSNVSAVIYHKTAKHFVIQSAEELCKGADFIFQKDLEPAHTAKRTNTWFNDSDMTAFNWQENLTDQSPQINYWALSKGRGETP